MRGLPAAAARPVTAPLLDVAALLAAYETLEPDPGCPAQAVSFGTSGHRGCAFERSFNRSHVLAITQAICDYRRAVGITGPLFVAIDTHAVSAPARATALQVLLANQVEACVAPPGEFTPTPVLSHAILRHNTGRNRHWADGVVFTPSHNPPRDGGYKYNPPHGGPAGTAITRRIETAANAYLRAGIGRRVAGAPPKLPTLASPRANVHDFMHAYIDDLPAVVNLPLIAAAGLRLAVDAMGGAGLQYWSRIAEQHHLDLTLFNGHADPQFAFMPPDRDGQIRMDPASPEAMRDLVARAPAFDLAFACDTDHDRHGIVTPDAGLLPPNHFLSAAADYLFRQRHDWPGHAGIGKSMVSTRMLERVGAHLGRPVLDMPVGFKWFVPGLLDGHLAFAGEESAGATLLRCNGQIWTTDKDGMVAGLLAAEMTAHDGLTPGHRYAQVAAVLGTLYEGRLAVTVDDGQRARLTALAAADLPSQELAGRPILCCRTQAPGNQQALGGARLEVQDGWLALRPSGTEALVRLYAESGKDAADVLRLLDAGRQMLTSLGECTG